MFRCPLCSTSKETGVSVTLAPREQSLTSCEGLLALILVSLFLGLRLSSWAISYSVIYVNGLVVLPIIVGAATNNLATHLNQHNMKLREKKSSNFCDSALSLVILQVAALVSCDVF